MEENSLQRDYLRESSRLSGEVIWFLHLKLFLQDRKLCYPTKPMEKIKHL